MVADPPSNTIVHHFTPGNKITQILADKQVVILKWVPQILPKESLYLVRVEFAAAVHPLVPFIDPLKEWAMAVSGPATNYG